MYVDLKYHKTINIYKMYNFNNTGIFHSTAMMLKRSMSESNLSSCLFKSQRLTLRVIFNELNKEHFHQ